MISKWKVALVVVIGAGVLVWLGSVSAKAPKPQSISGFVLSSAGNPIQNVSVDLTPTSQKDKAMHATTDASGHYEIKNITYVAEFDVSYSISGMDVSVVSLLSEQRGDQVVNKVLYRHGEARSALAIHDGLQSIERLLALGMSTKDGKVQVIIKDMVYSGNAQIVLDNNFKIIDTDERKEKLVRDKQRDVKQLMNDHK